MKIGSWLALAAASFGCMGPAFAQVLDLSGQWRGQSTFGQIPLTFQQNGSHVEVSYGPGGGSRMRGDLNGTTLSGTFADMGGAGTFEFVFSPDGRSFRGGSLATNGQRQTWTGTKIVQTEPTPQDILANRAGLRDVAASGVSYPQQAATACERLMAATFGQNGSTWVSYYHLRGDPRVLGAAPGGTYMFEFAGVTVGKLQPRTLSTADELNGFRFDGQLTYFAAAYHRTPLDQQWVDYRGPFAICRYTVGKTGASLQAQVTLPSGAASLVEFSRSP